MKRLLLAAFIVLLAVPAHAGWNLRQNDDGTTSWVREDSTRVQDTRTVGAVYLTVLVENVSTASSSFVASPVTDARINRVWSSLFGTVTGGDAVLTVSVMNNAGGGTILAAVSNGTSPFTIANTSSGAGDVDTFTPLATSVSGNVERGQAIAIETNGGSTGDVDAIITIELLPR